MVDLAKSWARKVLNFFFLVRTGRGRDLTDIDAAAYERILTWLAKAQGVGAGPPVLRPAAAGPRRLRRAAGPSTAPRSRTRGRRRSAAPTGSSSARSARRTSAASSGSSTRVAAPQELRARLVPGREVLLPDHARGRRHAVPVHAGVRGQPARTSRSRDLWRGAAVFDDLREPEARRPLRRLRVLEGLRRLPVPRVRDLRRLPRRGPRVRLPARRPRRAGDRAAGDADVRPAGRPTSSRGSRRRASGCTRSRRSRAAWW